MRIYLSHSSSFDFNSELYEPLKQSQLNIQHQIYFPHDTVNIDVKSKEVIQKVDLLIAEVSYASTGQGIELGWAEAQNIPIICFYKLTSKFSSSLKFVTSDIIEYSDENDFLDKLGNCLAVSQ